MWILFPVMQTAGETVTIYKITNQDILNLFYSLSSLLFSVFSFLFPFLKLQKADDLWIFNFAYSFLSFISITISLNDIEVQSSLQESREEKELARESQWDLYLVIKFYGIFRSSRTKKGSNRRIQENEKIFIILLNCWSYEKEFWKRNIKRTWAATILNPIPPVPRLILTIIISGSRSWNLWNWKISLPFIRSTQKSKSE